MPNLEELILFQNDLDDLHDNWLDGVSSSIKQVNLNNNFLTEIRQHQFSGLTLVYSLTIYGNRISNIESGTNRK